MNKRLLEQATQIVDEGEGELRTVIVRMETPADTQREILATASEAIRRRILCTTARDVLPAPDKTLAVPVTATTAKDTLRDITKEDTSMAANVRLGDVTVATLRRVGLEALAPLRASDVFKKAEARMSERAPKRKTLPKKRGKSPESSLPYFWSSKCAVLTLPKDEVPRLAIDVPQIGDIYPNRMLRVPRVVEAKRLPFNVEDNKTSGWGVHAIGALAAWGAYGSRGKGVRIAVLDTGVDAAHPDLEGKVDAWEEFDLQGNEVPDSKPHDTDRHGTHCAGIIAGGDASGVWIGVAPEAKLACGLVLDGEKGGSDAQVLAGIQWAIEQKVDVISMSLGGLTIGPDVPSTYTAAMIDALRLGIPVITAI
jgi:subtilisin family serine protease